MSSPSNSTVPPHFNYAKAVEIHSVIPAVIFAALYIPLLLWFLNRSFKCPTYVHSSLTSFCSFRVVAFSIRAALAGIEAAAENLNLLIVDEVLIGVGYFGLLYSGYTLVLDLELISSRPAPTNPILLIIRNRRIFRLALIAAVILGIVSVTNSNREGTTSQTLHKISVVMFLVLTVMQAIQTVSLALAHHGQGSRHQQSRAPFGRRYANLILLVIALLLLVREAFSTITVGNSAKQNTEHLWYPLIAVPEILAVVLYATPGLVPSRVELQEHENHTKHVALHPNAAPNSHQYDQYNLDQPPQAFYRSGV